MSEITHRIILPEEEIKSIVKRLASEISLFYYSMEKNDFNGRLLILPIFDGARPFSLDLANELYNEEFKYDNPLTVYIHNVEYSAIADPDGMSINNIKSLQEQFEKICIRDSTILIIDDIYDSGNSLYKIKKYIEEHNPRNVRICILLNRKVDKIRDITVDFVGKEIDSKNFLIGYGLDYHGKYRDLPFIAEI
jgi:hypoxanthine phosphoribosyltransferase